MSLSQLAESGQAPTLFSQARFAKAFSFAGRFRPYELRSAATQATVVGLETERSFGRRSIALAPFGLYAHPSGGGPLEVSVRDIVAQLKALSTTAFEWNVRFDHEILALALVKCGIPFLRSVTHALKIEGDYETTFAKFDATTRNLVRRIQREGIIVRRAYDPEDVSAYYEVHSRLASERGNYGALYDKSLFSELVKLRDDVIFAVAEVDGKVVGGAWFFRDGATLLYWHAAMDREYSRYSPSYAVAAFGIRTAHEEGRTFFNFGGSIGMASLEAFKSKWGAQPRQCWKFSWQNPIWQAVQRIRKVAVRHAG